MTTITTPPTAASVDRRTRSAGLWCLTGGLLGALQAVIVLAWPEQVSDDRYSYPFTSTWFVVAQLGFAVQHLMVLVGVMALLGLSAVRASRFGRIGVTGAAIGLALLAVLEVIATAARGVAEGSSRGHLVDDLYAGPVLLVGVGLLAAGIALVRRRSAFEVGWLPVIVLVLGIYVFVPLSPAMGGSFTAGRLGIGGWMLLFAVLGLGLVRERGRVGATSAAR